MSFSLDSFATKKINVKSAYFYGDYHAFPARVSFSGWWRFSHSKTGNIWEESWFTNSRIPFWLAFLYWELRKSPRIQFVNNYYNLHVLFYFKYLYIILLTERYLHKERLLTDFYYWLFVFDNKKNHKMAPVVLRSRWPVRSFAEALNGWLLFFCSFLFHRPN